VNVLFDLDGTLTDPREGIVACFKHALAGAGCACPTDAELERFIGPPLHETLGLLVGTDDLARFDLALSLFRDRFSAAGIYENTVYPEIPSALASLRALGAVLFVATSKPQIYAERIIQHFGLERHFKAIYGSELVGTRAGKADLIGHVLQSESLTASDTFMVGDRAQDVFGAKVNRVRAIGALWGYGTREELLEAGASVLVERPAMLAAVLSSNHALSNG
jgi:phosphoglycolate phosphatase